MGTTLTQPRTAAVLKQPTAQEQADAAYALVKVDPAQASAAALAVIASAGQVAATAELTGAVLTAMRAHALSLRVLSGPHAAAAVLRDAIRRGVQHRLAKPLAEVRMTYAAILTDLGRIDAALAECDRAAQVLRGNDAGRLLAQRGLVLSRAGRIEEALAAYARALPPLRATGDAQFQCLLYMNRANVLCYLGRLAAAERDLSVGIALAKAHGLRDIAQELSSNLGYLHARKGDIPAALRAYDQACESATTYSRLTIVYDRAEALLAVGLASEARADLERMLDEVVAAGYAIDAAEWRLTLAHAVLLDDDTAAARSHAAAARAAFRAQRRPRWAMLAEHVEIRARWAGGERSAALARRARDTYARLWSAGWQVAALHCLIVAGRVELDRGRVDVAREDLARAAAARRGGPAQLRAAAWYAEAMLRHAGGDTRGATTALKAGLGVVEDHAATLGATDLRVHSSGLGAELAAQGVRIAIAAAKPAAVLTWIERFRAGALRRRPARPPADTRLAADLAELRRVTAEIAAVTAAGDDTRSLRAEQVRLEAQIRQRSRHARGTSRSTTARSIGQATRDIDIAMLVGQLRERALVEILRADDTMYAVTAVDGRLRLRALGSYDAAREELASLRFAMHRLARRHGSAASLSAARDGVRHAAGALDAALLRPLADLLGERELVIVPTGHLHALPWPILPSCRSRPIAVAPSATTWLAAMSSAAHTSAATATVLVAGPRLDHAEPEVRALAELYKGPRVLTGVDATAEVVRDAIDGADLAHIAAHGRFRSDNPQFSALDLCDGPLTVYDLERLRRAPRRIVLSACDSGLSAVHPGDELMGLAGALFSLGTSTLVASVVPVSDDATRDLMLEFHQALCAGTTPAAALAQAQQRVDAEGFVCFGAS